MRKTIGKLECSVREGDEDGRYVVLLHGFGADASDLFPLADILDPDGAWTFVAPNAPLEVPIGPAWTGRGWFPISVRDLEVGVDFTRVRPPGLDESSALVSELIFELNPSKLVLGGFSQGAMIATDVAMNQPDDMGALVLYSGSLLDQEGWSAKASGLKGKPILQSHGSGDPVLPFAVGQQLFELLRSAGADIRFQSFPGGHEIPMPVLKKTREFLNEI